MFSATNWDAVSAIGGLLGVAMVIAGAVVKSGKKWMGDRHLDGDRIDNLEIRLFGLPADPKSGARKVDGEFDRIDAHLKQLDSRFDEVIQAVNGGKG